MQEYVDFLGKQDPYDRLDADDLAELGRRVEVEYFPAGAMIVEAEQPRLDSLFVVRTGIANVLDRGRVVDELGPGETFGHISVLSGLPPPLSVAAATDVLCYCLPDPRTVLAHPELLAFAHYNSLVSRPLLVNAANDYSLRPVDDLMRDLCWCEPEVPIRWAAARMSEQHQSSVVFRLGGQLGIMTDSDCRRRVATGEIGIDAPVRAAGNTPALTIASSATGGAALVQMVHHGVHHLIVVDSDDKAVGVVRAVDLGSADVRDPLVTRSAIDNAQSLDALRHAAEQLLPTAAELHASGIPALRIGALLGAMTEAVVEKCVTITRGARVPDELGATTQASWLVLGSLARREPLPWSDVDTAMVWNSLAGAKSPDPRQLHVRAEEVIETFESCGLRRCDDGANASNPLFNRSRDAWLAAATHWIDRPDADGALLLPAIVADSRPVTGVDLGTSVTGGIARLARSKQFLQSMLNDALAHRPPTGFVRDFVVVSSGEHRGKLNLKRGGLLPVVAIARWIAIAQGEAADSTVERLESGISGGVLTTDEGETLIGAFEQMYALLFEAEMQAIFSAVPVSTYLNPHDLDTLTRRHLRESFRAIAKVQSRLEAEWVSRLA